MDDINFNSAKIQAICKKYHVENLRLFGSTARGESGPDSDIDLLVAFSEPISLLQFVGMEREMSVALGRKVDLQTTESISPYLRTRILRESRSSMQRDDSVYLKHIRDAILTIQGYTKGVSASRFQKDKLIQE